MAFIETNVEEKQTKPETESKPVAALGDLAHDQQTSSMAKGVAEYSTTVTEFDKEFWSQEDNLLW